MTNDQTPDRVLGNDLDDLNDVPTYSAADKPAGMGKYYEKAGRTAPQSIQPESASEKTVTINPTDTASARVVSSSATAVSTSESEFMTEPTRDFRRVSADSEPTTEIFTGGDNSYDSQNFAANNTQTYAAAPVVADSAPAEPLPADFAAEYTEPAAAPVDARRGTLDLGIMIIRVALGTVLTATALGSFFGFGGAPSLDQLKTSFADYAMPDLLAIGVPTLQLVAGVFLLLGLLTPVAAAVAIAVTGFSALDAISHADSFQMLSPGNTLMLPILLAALAIGLQFSGPGKVSLDIARSWARRPLVSSWIWVIIGIAGAVAMWWFGAGINPLG